MPTEAGVDRLFQLPLAEFTRARNALAAELAKAGRTNDAQAVRGLPKPPISAWVVNQLHWRHRKQLDALFDLGERLRAAQRAQLAGKDVDLRALVEARRDVSGRLVRDAAAILREAKHAPTPETLRRVTTTLDALAAYGTSADGPKAGRLTDDVESPGFDAVATLAPGTTGRVPARVVPLRRRPAPHHTGAARTAAADDTRRARRSEARDALRAAETALRHARRAESDAKASLEKAAARAQAAAREKDTLRKEYERAAATADETAREAHHLARDVERATKAVSEAEKDLERAQAAAARARSG